LGTVSQSSPYIFNAGSGTDSQLHVKESLVSTVLTNKGYIMADNVIYVTARVIAGNGNQQSFGFKGLAALGTEYRIGHS
jgi:hypothetical protein